MLYRLNGGAHTPEETLPLSGYRGSAPVRVGNAAAEQVQLDTYGELLQTAWLYATGGYRLDRDIGRRLAQIADHPIVARIEPPGFLMLNYGRGTPAVVLAGHVAYGAIIGAFIALAG